MGSSGEFIGLGLVILGAAAVLYKLIDVIRSRRRPALWALWTALLLLVISVALGLSPLSGIGPLWLPWIVQKVVVLAALAALQTFFVLSIREHTTVRTRRALTGQAVLTLGMLAAFGMARLTEDARFLPTPDYLHDQWAVVTIALFTATLVWAMFDVALLSLRWSRVADARWLRRGLRSLAAGGAASMLWGAHKLLYITTTGFGVRLPWPQFSVETPLVAVAITLSLLGITMPAWGPRLSGVRTWLRHLRSYRRLAPLWRRLAGAAPHIVLPNPAPRHHAEFALYRRVVEIWDGRLALRPHLDRATAQQALAVAQAAGLTGVELAATVEAECWRAALAAYARGDAPTSDTLPPPEIGENLAAEVAFLERVAVALEEPSILDDARVPGQSSHL